MSRAPGGRAAAASLLSAIVALSCASRPPGIMSWPEYRSGTASYSWPYILELSGRDGELVYFGTRHSYDPDDPQLALLEEMWTDFRPTIALNEGGDPPVEPTRARAIRMHGESGLIRFLAARDNVPVATHEPRHGQEVARLRHSFSGERVRLFYVVRSVSQYVARNGEEGLDEEIDRQLRNMDRTPGLRFPPRTWSEVAEVFDRHLPGRGPVTAATSAWLDPVIEDTFLSEMSRATSDYRDAFMVQTVTRHVREGHRVFAVVGGSHVVMQEAGLRWELGR